MPAPADIVVFSKEKRPILVVEVKDTSLYSTPQDASSLRRNLIAHQLLSGGRFFMLATARQIFLWSNDARPDAPPNFAATAKSVLDAYGSRGPARDNNNRGGALEIVYFSWLSDLVSGIRRPSPDSESDRLVLDSGLYEQIRGGSAEFEVTL
jgi:hypothetical protein